MVRRNSPAIRLVGTCTLYVSMVFQPTQSSAQTGNELLSPAAGGHELVPGSSVPKARFIGSYGLTGRFKKSSKLKCAVESYVRPDEVPTWIDLHDHSETVLENFAPPNHGTQVVRPKSRSASLLERFATLAYGHEARLRAPTHLAVDSRQHLIVTDPPIAAVHILDGKQSLRISGGPGRRLQQPNGVALDKQDNIYVTDGKVRAILVYDGAGTFLHSIGSLKGGESIFEEPTGIAIDRENDRLYVLDSPSNELLVLGLDGNILQRLGGSRQRGGVKFENPTEIAVRDSTIAVLDSSKSRLQIFDLRFNLVNAFRMAADPKVQFTGLALDAAGDIYVSNGLLGTRIYRQEGTFIGTVSNCDKATPGIWIDSTNSIYLADPSANRILRFQQLSAAGERN